MNGVGGGGTVSSLGESVSRSVDLSVLSEGATDVHGSARRVPSESSFLGPNTGQAAARRPPIWLLLPTVGYMSTRTRQMRAHEPRVNHAGMPRHAERGDFKSHAGPAGHDHRTQPGSPTVLKHVPSGASDELAAGPGIRKAPLKPRRLATSVSSSRGSHLIRIIMSLVVGSVLMIGPGLSFDGGAQGR